jgi:hypothetical protein
MWSTATHLDLTRSWSRPVDLELVFAYHKGQTVPPGVVRKIQVKDVGLGETEALALVTRRRRT